MGLATLYNTPVDAVSLAEWSFSHADNHENIVRFIREKHPNVTGLVNYVLDPIDLRQIDIWLYQHQIMHNQFNQVLGIAGESLTSVDWNDPEALSQFIDTNASEHLQANAILGIP